MNHYRRPIGYLEARAAIKDIERYRDLVRHYFNYAGDTEDAQSIEKLIKNYDPARRHTQIPRAINEMSLIMDARFRRIGNNCTYTWTDTEYDHVKHKEVKTETDRHMFIKYF